MLEKLNLSIKLRKLDNIEVFLAVVYEYWDCSKTESEDAIQV